MGHQEQDRFGRFAVAALREDQFVIDRDESVLHLFTLETREFPHSHEYRQEQFQGEASQLPGEGNIVSLGHHDGQQPQCEDNHRPREDGEYTHDQGQVHVYAVESVVGDYEQDGQDPGGEERHKENKGDYYPLFRMRRTGVGLRG